MEIIKSLISINKEIEAIGKNRKNETQGFKFRGIDDVMNELHGLFSKHEVIINPIVSSSDVSERTNQKGTLIFHTRLNVNFEFIASDGSKIQSTAIGEAMDSGDKGINKAMSIALKYVLLQMFLIPTEDEKDPDSATHEIKPKAEPETKPKIVWLTKEQFEKALNSDLKGLKATVTIYSTDTHKMKKEYYEKLSQKLKQLDNGIG